MGLSDFFEELDRSRNEGYERSLKRYNDQKAIQDAAEKASLLPNKKVVALEHPAAIQILPYKGKGEFKEWQITSKDGRSVIVHHPDSIEAANIGEDALKITRYSGERRQIYTEKVAQVDFWRPTPPDGFPYVSAADGITLDLANRTYSINGAVCGYIRTSTKRWPGHEYVYNGNGELRWVG